MISSRSAEISGKLLTSLFAGEAVGKTAAGEAARDTFGEFVKETSEEIGGRAAEVGEALGKAGEMTGEISGEGAGKTTGEASGETSGEAAGETAREITGEAEGEAAGEVAGCS